MQRPSLWLMIVVLLAGILFLREPRLEKTEDVFLRWLLNHAQLSGPNAPLTVVEVGREQLLGPDQLNQQAAPSVHVGPSAVSPLEFALFLQAALDFRPAVIAFENILKWRERDKDQEQVFIDQAMRAPRLLLGAELTFSPEPDNSGPDIAGFPHVDGKRGNLVEFTGIGRQPEEDLRLISTAGFVNLPEDIADDLHVPLLFSYRGEVVPSFALESVLLWLRLAPNDVKIHLGSDIELPEGRRIPITDEGTMIVAPHAAIKATRISLNELLLAAEQRDSGEAVAAQFDTLRDQIVLVRTPANPLAPPDIFAATIATIQTNRFVHRISIIFDCVVLAIAAALAVMLQKYSRVDITLAAIAFTAGYCLLALGLMSRWQLWLPGVLPLGAIWLLVVFSPMVPRLRRRRGPSAITVPPPIA
ncbi:MAG: hypothetical protein ACJ8JD_11055 [Chthoniobacterales bacterium]